MTLQALAMDYPKIPAHAGEEGCAGKYGIGNRVSVCVVKVYRIVVGGLLIFRL